MNKQTKPAVRRRGRSGALALWLALAAGALGACRDVSDGPQRATAPRAPKAAQQLSWALGTEAARLRDQAVAGVRRRGEQDEMLKLEARLPGFGGFFIDSLGEVVAWQKPMAGGVTAATIRSILAAKYAAHGSQFVREVMAPAAVARVLDAAYTLSELVAIESRVAHSPAIIKGYAGVGTSVVLNRVKVG